MKHIYPISGMHCASCALSIEKELNKLPEVKSANVNFANEKLFLEVEGEPDLDKLKKVVSSVGNYQLIIENHEPKHQHYEKHSVHNHGPAVSQQKKLMIWSVVLTAAVFLINWFLDFSGKNLLMLILATPVQFYIGRQFYQAAIPAL